MSRARHKARKDGGSLNKENKLPRSEEKEVDERKRGGRMEAEGEKKKGRHDRARGGQIPGRKRGGGIGANLTPLSTAARVKHITKGETPEEGVPE